MAQGNQEGNQIRLVSHAFKCEAIYYLKGAGPDPDEIANRLLKHNTGVHTDNPESFMKDNIINDSSAVPPKKDKTTGKFWDYHGELKDLSWKGPLQGMVKEFCSKIETKDFLQKYEFYEIGICVAKKVDKKGKFGNIEIKYKPKGVPVAPGINPDRMVSINLHVVPKPTTKRTTLSLKTDTVIKEAKAFLDKASALFENANLDGDFRGKGFRVSGHELTVKNLEKYQASPAAQERQRQRVLPRPFQQQHARGAPGGAPMLAP